jgi:MYXO-CTERM domain-containing protein
MRRTVLAAVGSTVLLLAGTGGVAWAQDTTESTTTTTSTPIEEEDEGFDDWGLLGLLGLAGLAGLRKKDEPVRRDTTTTGTSTISRT